MTMDATCTMQAGRAMGPDYCSGPTAIQSLGCYGAPEMIDPTPRLTSEFSGFRQTCRSGERRTGIVRPALPFALRGLLWAEFCDREGM